LVESTELEEFDAWSLYIYAMKAPMTRDRYQTTYTRLAKRPLIFRSFTGLTISEFDFIYNELESKYDEHERARRLSKMNNRQRNMGAGKPFKLKVKERFLMLLVYYRLYITYTLSGFLFDLDQSNVCRDISVIDHLSNCVSRCQRSCINVQEGLEL